MRLVNLPYDRLPPPSPPRFGRQCAGRISSNSSRTRRRAARAVRSFLCYSPGRDERKDPVKPTSTLVQMDQKEEETLSFEVSDEALESAAVTEMAALTLALCTGLMVCPSW